MSYSVKLVTCSIAAFLFHLVLGWPWTLAAGVGAGVWQGPGGWRLGAAAVGIDWAVWLAYNYSVDIRAVHVMTETMGAVLGNMPFFVVVALTLLIGLVLGGLGGMIGTQLHHILKRTRNVPA